jgi:hypothetical protein
LPAAALQAVRAVEPGVLSGPVRAPFGYLFLREASRRGHPDIPMEAALPLVIAWASRPSEGDLGFERDMDAYYREHRDEFSAPDTLTFRVWLLPEPSRSTVSRRLEKRERMHADTADTRSLTVGEKDLPPKLREDLAYYQPCRQGETLGPIRSAFGLWYLRVLEVRKGGRPLTLAESRPALRKILFGWDGKDALDPVLSEAKARERDLRASIAEQYLMARKPGAGSSWERKRNDWMRNHLVLRFVDLPDPDALAQ